MARCADLLATDETWTGGLQFAAVLSVGWWAWASTTLYANRFDTDAGVPAAHPDRDGRGGGDGRPPWTTSTSRPGGGSPWRTRWSGWCSSSATCLWRRRPGRPAGVSLTPARGHFPVSGGALSAWVQQLSAWSRRPRAQIKAPSKRTACLRRRAPATPVPALCRDVHAVQQGGQRRSPGRPGPVSAVRRTGRPRVAARQWCRGPGRRSPCPSVR
ncbi:hypothetical protein [Micromonospora sp. RTP1Z1]|uniref:hypothetical protein n=1 Tax=Micromonospora sp. RTP1Z1 TaxID=2994043 RepID=UPI0029C67A49|nr:hypothetical protein [Micromonospora sp. RTP1Z1]